MNLALIVCDEPQEPLLARHGGYPQMLTNFFNPVSAEQVTTVTPFDLFRKDQLPADLSSFDGLIISGSVRSVNEPLPWVERLLTFVRANYLDGPDYLDEGAGQCPEQGPSRPPPLLGICFGHQIVCRACAIPIVPSVAWELGWTQIELSPAVQDIFGPLAQLRLISSHREEAARVPEGFLNLGSSVSCPIQGIYSPSRGILAFQGHPELCPEYIVELAERRLREGIIPPQVHAQAMSTRDRPLDREPLLRGITKFFDRHQARAVHTDA